MCDPRDPNRRCASAAAGPEPRDHRHGHTPRSVPGGSGTYCSGESTISPSRFSRELTARAPPRRHAAHNYIRSYMLMQIICLCKQYACANNMLYESSSTSSTSTSSEEDRRSIKPSLRGEEPRGGLPIPESGRWI